MAGNIEQVPIFNKTDNSLLLVHLTVLDQDVISNLTNICQKTLQHPAQIQMWTPDKYLLQSVARQYRSRDSVANLYAVAILLYRTGRSSFIVADDLTNRQLTGNCRFGEDKSLSVVEVKVEPKLLITANIEDEVWVHARRVGVLEPNQLNGLIKSCSTKVTSTPSSSKRDATTWGSGTLLHDPDWPPFTADLASSLGRVEYMITVTTALSQRRLPQELINEIVSLADREALPPADMRLWKQQQGKEHIHIFLLFFSNEQESARLQSTLEKIATDKLQRSGGAEVKFSVELIPQDRHGIQSRRDLLSFWKDYRAQQPESEIDDIHLQVLLSPFEEHEVSSAQFATLYADRDGNAIIRRESFGTLLNRNRTSPLKDPREVKFCSPENVEKLRQPNKPSYFQPPLWVPVKESLSDGEIIEWAPVFYLTNKLNSDQDKNIRQELITKNDIDEEFEVRKDCCYVPWERHQDGTPQDIWEIIWEVYQYDLHRSAICCIDQQSGEDNTVLLVKMDYYFEDLEETKYPRDLLKDLLYPDIRGFKYVRVPARDVHTSLINLAIANMGIEDMGDQDLKSFHRPGWPNLKALLPYIEDEDIEEDLAESL
ncbi:hypothetical protein BGW36DRAFT_363374 [Talaromyces proteolyticus]|uniref:Uncharacterized protein n=1 Tax=Talaromyces proteolyticus TaxID=1131652 RepID=A0AAD4PWY7_9EURO|nr:uncharacterized protein BGW36DRAFT_363374 [Talaromyces proteolyticus]KAH8692382.1 hypothetical protein BGW36DRAFT_363374 [Talaromyces proteolyticus]